MINSSPTSHPFLSTKVSAPLPRSGCISRSRLHEQLRNGSSGPLTLVAAPAGFGKTTLVREWLSGRGQPTAWLSLDAGDNDPARFWSYVIAALQTVHPGIGDAALAAFASP